MRAHSYIAHEICPRRLAIGPPLADMPAGLCSQAASPVGSTPAADCGIPLGSPPAAASIAFRSGPSLEDLTRIHSPYVSFVDPAVGSTGVNFAELKLARLQPRHNAGLREGNHLGVQVAVVADGGF